MGKVRTLAWVLVPLLAGCGASMFLRLRHEQVSEQVKVVLGGGGNSTVLLHGAEALVVDTKLGDFSRRLRRQVEEELGRKVRRLLLTHSHGDHAGNAAVFRSVGAVLVHPNTKARLVRDPPRGTPPSLPFVEVTDEVQLWLDGEEVRVLHRGKGHTDGDLVAYLPAHRLLVTGDLVVSWFEPRIDEEAGGDALAFGRTVERLLELDFTRVVPGHGEVAGRELVERYREYFRALEAAVRAAVEAGKSEEAVVEEVKLNEFDDLKPMPMGISSRAETVRLMYKAVKRTWPR